ncbi:MAG: hypothetical protein O9267_01390 [Flavobacterium sp.]|nr:hypothetical protein [Flavobacterium sp.]MCZ8196242.1 hypothetical protein [Flavobacterium sp.]
MSKQEKHIDKKQKKNDLIKKLKVSNKCKSSCCEKYIKSEKKRCKKCPMFDLIKKIKKVA